MRPDAGSQTLAQGLGEGHAVAFHHQIDVVVGNAQQHIPHKAAHGVDIHTHFPAGAARQPEQFQHVRGQTLPQQVLDVLLLPLARKQGVRKAGGFLHQQVDQIRAGDDSDHLLPAQHRHQPLPLPQDDLHDPVQVLVFGDGGKILLHVFGHPFRSQPVPHGLFRHAVLDDAADLLPVLHDGQGFQAVADHHLGGLGHGLSGLDADHRRRHELADHHLRIDVGVEQGEKLVLHLGNGAVLDGGRGRVGVSASAEGSADDAHVHFRSPAAGHELDSVAHAPDGEEDAHVFHIHQFVDEQGEISDVGVQIHFGHHHADAADGVRGGGLDELRKNGHLFGGQLPVHDFTDGFQLHALGLEPGRGLEIVLRGGVEGEAPGVLEDAKAHDGGLVGRHGQGQLPQAGDHDGGGGAPDLAVFHIGGNGVLRGRVVVEEMDGKPRQGKEGVHMLQPGSVPGVDDDQAAYFLRVQILQVLEVEEIHDALDEIVLEGAVLSARKDHGRAGIQLSGGDHGGQGVEIRVGVAGDDGVGHGSRAGMKNTMQAEHARGLHVGVYFRGHDVAVSEQNRRSCALGSRSASWRFSWHIVKE